MAFWFCFITTIPSYTLLRWRVNFPTIFFFYFPFKSSVWFFSPFLYKYFKDLLLSFLKHILMIEDVHRKGVGETQRYLEEAGHHSAQCSESTRFLQISFIKLKWDFLLWTSPKCIMTTVPSLVPRKRALYLKALFLCLHQNHPFHAFAFFYFAANTYEHRDTEKGKRRGWVDGIFFLY